MVLKAQKLLENEISFKRLQYYIPNIKEMVFTDVINLHIIFNS